MKGIIVSFYAMTASFRDPNTHLYHETILSPPPSTLVGFAGAALGKEYKDVFEYFKDNKISVGCITNFEGMGKDLWNYNKIKSSGVITDIVMREFLYKIEGDIFYACEDEKIVEELFYAFNNPYFALSLGSSDEIIKIIKIEKCIDIRKTQSNKITNTWIPGNLINEFELDWEKVKSLPIKSTIKPPIIKNLPIDFSFSKNGEREAIRLSKFTFLGDVHQLKQSISTYRFYDKETPLFTFGEM